MAINTVDKEFMENYISEMKNTERGIKTGLIDFDYVLGGGLKKGALYVVGGRPSMGKTSFALNLCKGIAEHGNEKVLYYSLEMSSNMLVSRFACMQERMDFRKIRKPDDETFENMIEFSNWISGKNFYCDDTPGLSISEIRSNLDENKIKDLDVIVIDYMQLMSAGKENYEFTSRQSEIEYVCRQLKEIAREYNVAIVVLSQLSRACEQRPDHRPLLSDLRESGAIEVYADVVIMLYRDEYYNMDTELKNIAEVMVSKNHYGSCGLVQLVWNPEYMIFANIVRPSN